MALGEAPFLAASGVLEASFVKCAQLLFRAHDASAWPPWPRVATWLDVKVATTGCRLMRGQPGSVLCL